MAIESQTRYTLIVPTFNRPAHLRSLLDYLAARRFPYPVRVLDSSEESASAQNRASVASARLAVAHRVYDPATPVFEKFRLGTESVDTPYCSFCADDDVLFTRRVGPLLDVLDDRPELVAAHGYYLNFKPGSEIPLINMAYSAPSIEEENALARIVAQMRDYEAIFYAIHRTGALQSVLARIASMQSLWATELLSSSLTLMSGGVYRERAVFLARNTNASVVSDGWHPHHFFAREPADLLREYAAYRAVALAGLDANDSCSAAFSPEQIRRVFDLVHLRYLIPSLSPRVLDDMIAAVMRAGGVARDGAIPQPDAAAPAPAGMARSAVRQLVRMRAAMGRANRMIRLLATLRLKEGLGVSASMRLDGAWVHRVDREGCPRRYMLTPTLFDQELKDGCRIAASHVAEIVEHLDDYVLH